MRRYLSILFGGLLFELLAMSTPMMHLAPGFGWVFGVAGAALLLATIWEKPKPDERDNLITWRSSHVAFLAVSTVLIGVLAYQTLTHQLDYWLITAVGTLIFAKFFGRWSAGRRS